MKTKDALLARSKRRHRNELIPGFGEIRIRSLSAREEFRLGTLLEFRAADNFAEAAVLMIETLVDESGAFVFDYDRTADLFEVPVKITPEAKPPTSEFSIDPRFDAYLAELTEIDRAVMLPIAKAIKAHLGLSREKSDPAEDSTKN